MLTRIALACAALLAMAIAYMPTQASAHGYGWRSHHRACCCYRCHRPVVRRPVRRRVIGICYGRFCSDRGAGVVRPVVVATYRTWLWRGWCR